MAQSAKAVKKRSRKAQSPDEEQQPKRPRRSRIQPVNYRLPELFNDDELEPSTFNSDENDTDEDYTTGKGKREHILQHGGLHVDEPLDKESELPTVKSGKRKELKPELSDGNSTANHDSDSDIGSSDSGKDALHDHSDAEAAGSAQAKNKAKRGGYKAERHAGPNNVRLLAHDAVRTMTALLEDRNNDIVRHILLKRDVPKGSPYDSNFKRLRLGWQYKTLLWPPIGIQRYLNYLGPNPYRALGVDPMKAIDPGYGDVELEEPGGEQDAVEIANFESMRNNPSLSEVAAIGDDADDVISDPARNGDIGLVIRRTNREDRFMTPGLYASSGNHSGEEVQFVTKQQLKYPELLAPRYNRAFARGDASRTFTSTLDRHFKPLVDMTRSHVINQVRSYSGSSRPLSKFVSTTIAEESTLGVSQIWESLNSFWQNGKEGDKKGGLLLGNYNTGWLGILEAAVQAGIPDEVIARSYARLYRLCDVNIATDEVVHRVKLNKFRNLLKQRMCPIASTAAPFEVSDSEPSE